MKTELERLEQNLAAENKLGLAPPVFFNHEPGPSLSFFHSIEDGQPRLIACWRFEDRMQVIALDRGDVHQLEKFCQAWRLAGTTTENLAAEVDEGLRRLNLVMHEYQQTMAAKGAPR